MPPADSWSRVRAPASALDKVGLRLDELIQLQTGRSSVGIRSLGELCVWLDECTYVSDDERIGLREHWSHPDEFERGRAGDCEDFALWTWWELGSLGYAAELLAGKQVGGGGPPGGGHVWVQFSVAGQEFLIDGTGGAASDMIRSLAEATDHFCPWFAVDRTFRVYCYSGYFQLSAGTVGRVAVTPRGGRADRADVLPPPPIFEPAETRTIEDPVPRAGEVRRSQRPPPHRSTRSASHTKWTTSERSKCRCGVERAVLETCWKKYGGRPCAAPLEGRLALGSRLGGETWCGTARG